MDDREAQYHSEFIADISAYIDGELSPDGELRLEKHLASCEACTSELNRQKSFLQELSFSLGTGSEIDVPGNFTRSVVTNAQSRVGGLRGPRERFNAIFICAALGLFALFALGPESDRIFAGIVDVAEKGFAILYFTGHVAYDIAFGITRILRSLMGDSPNQTAAFIFGTALAALVVAGLIARMALRSKRTVGS
jgi:anti-sigma factor RsiW